MPQSMLRIALWNTRKKAVVRTLQRLAETHDLNVLVILERGDSVPTILDALGEGGAGPWFLTQSFCERVTMLTRFSDTFSRALMESERFTIRSISLPGLPEVIVAAVHLRSRLHQNERSQTLAAAELVRSIESVEASVGHRRTLVFGDFNMDPFDDGMVAAGALHAMITRRTALLGSRVVDKKKFPMFYNPMWRLLGDRESGPPGTYRYWSSEHVCREWHMFDQVLVRPPLIHAFPTERLRVLSEIDQYALVNGSGIPTISDHLPLVFELNEPGENHGG